MTDWVIGDETFAEEINTTYDQEQPIGDTPNAYFGAGAEPIDAKNGTNFMDVGKLGESLTCDKCGGDGWYLDGYEEKTCSKCKGSGFESLNKDGTGVARAVRGLDPTKTKRKWLRFVYVSKSDCDICKPFDGKTYHIDDEDRPCIPRLEEWDGAHPITHPNCKCKWVRTFDPEDFGGESFIGEASHPQNHPFLSEYPKGSPEEFDECQSCGFPASDHKAFNGEARDDLEEEDIQLARKEYGDAFDKANDIEQGWMVIQSLLKRLRSGEVKLKAGESEPSAYPIQKMLTDIVNKTLNKTEQQEIQQKTEDGFNLTAIMELVATKLAAKLGKKLGVESVAREYDPMDEIEDDDEHVGAYLKHNVTKNLEDTEKAFEGGRGSGKVGHAPWMVGGEAMDDCKNCMIQTERDGNGKCILCGG